MTEPSEHTGLPWRTKVDHNTRQVAVLDKSGGQLCRVTWITKTGKAHALAIAAFIVRAVNAHEKLVEALKAARSTLQDCFPLFTGLSGPEQMRISNLCDKITMDLEAAKGGTG